MNTGRSPEPQLLHAFFDRAADRWPEHVAVEVPPDRDRARQRTSYAALKRQADALAALLSEHVHAECVVAVLLPRSSHYLFAAQMAILKVGAAHLCLDPSFPDEHVGFVLQDANAVALLTDAEGAGRAKRWLPAERLVDVTAEHTVSADVAPPHPDWLTPRSLAYVIYTSGTTGRPKGVMIEHRSIANLVGSDLELFALTPDDRVAQNSSPAYDSALEETWLALAAGATLVVLDDVTVRLGPDLVPWLRDERITVFCPPPTLLRTTGCVAPWRELPDLRLLYVGGEALPQDLADRWARGRMLWNGYGPTECSVTVVRTQVRGGEDVAIGKPVRGNEAQVVDPETGAEVLGEEPGELWLSGVALARGYLGRPELTAERFLRHPRFGRIYRTGDLVQRRTGGQLYYLGRIDSQVKLRGHRLELEAVEAQLAACAGVREAACRLQGDGAGQVLAAHVVPADPGSPPAPEALRSSLRDNLPAVMVPSRWRIAPSLPRTVGGKLDRLALPEIAAMATTDDPDGTAPRDEVEERIAAAFARALGRFRVPVDGDFFDLGGESVRAAELISMLRADDSTAATLTVRDVYEARTVAGLAARARGRERGGPRRIAQPTGTATRTGRPRLVTLLQGVWLLLALITGSALAYAVLFWILPWLVLGLGLIPLLLLLPPIGLALWLLGVPLSLTLAVAAKRLLIGRYSPLRAPAWSGFHFRNWIVQRLVRVVPWGWIAGTELQCMALRLLGARIGGRVHIHRGVDLLGGGWDLLEIGDAATLSQDASVGLVELDDGHLVVAPVTLGTGSVLDVRAGVAGDTEIGADGWLGPLSALPRGARLPRGERWDGVPARPSGKAPPPPPPVDGERLLAPLPHALLQVGARFVLGWLLGLPFVLLAIATVLALGLTGDFFLAWLYAPWSSPLGVLAAAGLVCVSVPPTLVLQALLLRWSKRVATGTWSRLGTTYVRIWLRTGLLHAAGRWLSGTLFWPLWLRLAGARIGCQCEVSTVIDVLPEQLTLGDLCFLADGIYLGGVRLQRGTATVAATRLGSGTFLGNHVVVPGGSALPDDVLLGVCTVADPFAIRKGTAWFGNPPFELPRREVVTVDRRLTHEPTALRWATRFCWETARLLLPAVPLCTALLWFDLAARAEAAADASALLLAALPALTFLSLLALPLWVLALKWALLGRVRPGQHPLWSCWCSRWDFVYVAWNAHARGLLAGLEGTLWLPFYLRAMGMRIGRRVVLGGGFAQVVDPDMLALEDHATVDGMFQAHSFEDRVLKIDRVTIRRGATVRRAAVLMYGADLGERCRVEPHSVVMKRERLLPEVAYDGCPTQAVDGAL